MTGVLERLLILLAVVTVAVVALTAVVKVVVPQSVAYVQCVNATGNADACEEESR